VFEEISPLRDAAHRSGRNDNCWPGKGLRQDARSKYHKQQNWQSAFSVRLFPIRSTLDRPKPFSLLLIGSLQKGCMLWAEKVLYFRC
jgi:hypothetical protein